MMKLHWSPRSPFVRKVMIVLHETGLISQVDCVRSVVAMSQPPNAGLMPDNPLNKIPTLVTEQGLALFDSRVVCEYLDMKAGSGLFPADPDRRMRHLRWQALADGMTDNLLLWRTELTRPTGPWEAVASGWLAKTRAAMAVLEHDSGELARDSFGIGHVALICALGQMDFRWPDCQWRDHFPTLAGLERELSQRLSVLAAPVATDETEAGPPITATQLTFTDR